jgi:hypothetical protein
MTGKTYEQLVEEKRQDQTVQYIDDSVMYSCYTCDGKPTRTYTNPAGNMVAAYAYRRGVNTIGRETHSTCRILEERYELKDGIVVDQWFLMGVSNYFPVYTENVCALSGVTYVNKPDPPVGPHKPLGWR